MNLLMRNVNVLMRHVGVFCILLAGVTIIAFARPRSAPSEGVFIWLPILFIAYLGAYYLYFGWKRSQERNR
jgi:hypothetical protein